MLMVTQPAVALSSMACGRGEFLPPVAGLDLDQNRPREPGPSTARGERSRNQCTPRRSPLEWSVHKKHKGSADFAANLHEHEEPCRSKMNADRRVKRDSFPLHCSVP